MSFFFHLSTTLGSTQRDPLYETQLVGVSGRVTTLANAGSSVWVGSGNGQVDIFANDSQTRLASVHARSAAISLITVAGEYVWLAATDGGVSIFTHGGTLVEKLAAHSAKVMGMAAIEKHLWTMGAGLYFYCYYLKWKKTTTTTTTIIIILLTNSNSNSNSKINSNRYDYSFVATNSSVQIAQRNQIAQLDALHCVSLVNLCFLEERYYCFGFC